MVILVVHVENFRVGLISGSGSYCKLASRHYEKYI